MENEDIADGAQVTSTCAVEAFPEVVDAGAELVLKARISVDPPVDLTGETVFFEDADGEETGSAVVIAFDGEVNETGELVVRAPATIGTYSWRAVLPAAEDEEDDPVGEVSSTFTFTVRAHQTRLVVWDVPSAIPAGGRFAIKAGVKCSSECPMAGQTIDVFDDAGNLLATGAFGTDIWPNSTGLHFVEISLEAPSKPGLRHWSARVGASQDGLPHAEMTADFGVTTVPEPEFKVAVKAIDADKKAPLKRAKVVMHPYRVMTNEEGVAEFRVPRGKFRVFVSHPQYESVSRDIEVSEDMSTTAELLVEPPEDLAAPYR